jgi:hypothetical protein
MLRNIILFHDLAQDVVKRLGVSWQQIRSTFNELLYELCAMKYVDPLSGQDVMTAIYGALNEKIRLAFETEVWETK